MDIKKTIKEMEPELYDMYRYLHENPELSMQEYNTCAYLKKMLQNKTNVDRIVQIGETGLMVEIKGNKPGPEHVIALRGDIDALPIQEVEGNDPRSKVAGVMHACGHDMHATILFGTVCVLENYRDQIAGSILFFFQPAEETLEGAQTFIDSPEVDFNKIEGVVGIHVLPDMDVGYIGATRGTALATADNFDVVVHGKHGHAAHPHTSIDPVITASQMICSLQTIVSREIATTDPSVLSITKVQAGGERYGIISDTAKFGGTMRTATTETRLKMRESIIRICKNVADSMRATVDIDFHFGNPPVINDDSWFERMYRSGEKLLGKGKVKETNFRLAAEDFGFMLEKCPGLYLRVGCRTPEGHNCSNHQPDFYCDRSTIEIGVVAMSGIALDFFKADY